MDSWLSVPILSLLLLFSQLTFANSSSSGVDGGKEDDLPDGAAAHSSPDFNQQDILRLLIMAAQNRREPMQQFRGQSWGIPFRPVRRIGSEFLGKRSDIPPLYEYDDMEKRARMGSEFLGKRGMGSEFLGKRGMGSEFLGKRGMGSEFLGKRGMGSEFLGKRGMGSEFLGKRGMGSEFLGKRGMGSEFLGKRGMGSEFLGKRGMGSEFLGKRRMGSEFLGKREDDNPSEQEYIDTLPPQLLLHNYGNSPLELDGESSHLESPYNLLVAKRGMGSEFLGKRKQSYDYNWKRGRLGSEFLGKRSTTPEQPYPYLQTDAVFDLSSTGKLSSGEDKHDANPTPNN